jgi:uncharacterized protein YjbI with pentapeptide repeats
MSIERCLASGIRICTAFPRSLLLAPRLIAGWIYDHCMQQSEQPRDSQDGSHKSPSSGWNIVQFDFFRSPPEWLAAFCYILAAVVCVVVIFLVFLFIYAAALVAVDSVAGKFDQRIEAAKVFFPIVLAFIGGPFLIWRVVTSHLSAVAAGNQAATTRETHYTSLFTKAVEQLGSTREVIAARNPEQGAAEENTISHTEANLEVRLGAIYALERIAQDSERDHWPIMEVLSAYVRNEQNCGMPTLAHPIAGKGKEAPNVRPRVDIQAALTVIGRRSPERVKYEKEKGYSLDFSRASLKGVIMENGDFSDASFFACSLDFANFNRTNLDRAKFSSATLQKTSFFSSKLNRAEFTSSKIEHAHFDNAEIQGGYFGSSTIKNTTFNYTLLSDGDFAGANISGAHFLKANLDNVNFRKSNFEWMTSPVVGFHEADFGGWDNSWCRFEDVEIFHCDFSHCLNLSAVDFEDALGDASTKLPSDVIRPESWPVELLDSSGRIEWIYQTRMRRFSDN